MSPESTVSAAGWIPEAGGGKPHRSSSKDLEGRGKGREVVDEHFDGGWGGRELVGPDHTEASKLVPHTDQADLTY